MKKSTFILILLLSLQINAQKELWATNANGYGGIFKSDFNLTNIQDVHFFDSINGMKPYGRLFVASNGKLYGTAREGGLYNATFVEGGVLYEYDLIFNTFRVVAHLGSTQFPTTNNPYAGVIEPVTGILYGSAESGAIYKYTIATETISISANVPNFFSGGAIISNSIRGELVKASNGLVYGTTKHYSNNLTGAPYLGSIARINTTNNNFSLIYPFELVTGPLFGPTGGLVEAVAGKLYGTTRLGGIGTYTPTDPFNLGGGTLFEYTIATNTLAKKTDFDYYTTGSGPGALCLANGKLYGILGAGGAQSYGSLFEYDITNNTINIIKHFGYENDMGVGLGANGSLFKGSDNNLYGISSLGIFKYETATNTFTQFYGGSILFSPSVGELLEICRKPSYHFFNVDTFDACIGSTFTYDIQNTNATSYQWQQNNINVAGQTTGVLSLTNLTTSNAGTYTCVMTNECGTTTTMELHLTVNCLGTNTVATLDKSIKLYPNPTNSILNIELPTNIDVNIMSLKVIDLLGKEVVLSSNTITKIDVSNLSNGIYIISLQTNYGSWNGKFVKE